LENIGGRKERNPQKSLSRLAVRCSVSKASVKVSKQEKNLWKYTYIKSSHTTTTSSRVACKKPVVYVVTRTSNQ
jgi:hypothetical protein